ncbi:MAG: DUF455 family protein [Candidatus Binatia bacterium]
MTSASSPALDPALFAPSPARDARFTVAARWAECANFAPTHPLRAIEFLHRQMNEEIDSLECSAANLRDFPEAPWDLRLSLARQCADEGRHAAMFRRIFERRGGHVGQYPVLNFQYRIVAHIRSLVGRLAIQNRSFEAGGLDAIAYGIEQARREGDEEMVELFEAQQADEISHVRFANEWINAATAQNARSVMEIGAALAGASKAFHQVMGPEATEGVSYNADSAARREAGFSDSEVGLAIELQSQPAGRSPLEALRRG